MGVRECLALFGGLVLGCQPRALPKTLPPRAPTASAPPTPAVAKPAPTPPVESVFGTAAPYTLLATDPEGKWVALCQAREDTDLNGVLAVGFMHHGESVGDRMAPYLVVGGGPGQRLESFIDADPSGRFVLVKAGGRYELRDVRNGTTRDLGSLRLDAAPDPSPALGPRIASFGRAGRHLLLLGESPDLRSRTVLFDLARGAPSEVDFGPGRIWHAMLSPDETWAFARVVTRDKNGNKKLDLPEVATTLDDDPCGQPSSYSTFGPDKDADEYEERVVPLSGGKARTAVDFRFFAGGRAIRREKDGRIVAESADGKLETLVPASCKGPILAASSKLPIVVVACGAPLDREQMSETKYPIARIRPTAFVAGKPHELALPVDGFSDVRGPSAEPFDVLYSQEQYFVFDFETALLHRTPEGHAVCAYHGTDVLLEKREGGGAWLWRPRTKKLDRISARRCGFGEERERWVVLGDELFDFDASRVVGRFSLDCDDDCLDPRRVLALGTDGRVLVTTRSELSERETLLERLRLTLGPGGRHSAAKGPLAWLTATPVAP